jgi:thiamine-phosphate pyrophosphorylase
MNAPPNRCRIVLIAPPASRGEELAEMLLSALSGGDVASVILPAYGHETELFQDIAGHVTPLLQERGIAVMIAGDSHVAGRVGADGLHVGGGPADISEAISRHRPRMMVGAEGGQTRHDALEIGELCPDYVFFGRIGYDRQGEPHPRNLALGAWWAEMVEIPCLVQGGSDPGSVEAVAATGAEFVALSAAVFGGKLAPAESIALANAILDKKAPRFDVG